MKFYYKKVSQKPASLQLIVGYIVIILITNSLHQGLSSSFDFQIPENELNSLLSFSHGITNDPNNVLQNWTRENSSSACSWSGVQCAMSQSNQSINIVNLTLTNLRLEGTISSALGQLSFLQHLDLSYNSLHYTIPLSIATNCTALQYLDLSHNHLTGSIPDYNTNLPSLVWLLLSNNQLSGSMPTSINSTSLNCIDLSYNNISGTLPLQYNSRSLQYLLLSDNKLTGTLPSVIANITSLQYLQMLDNSLTGEIPLGFSFLIVFGVGGNDFGSSIPADLFNSSTLKQIDLSMNNLTGTIPYAAAGHEAPLAKLYLHDNELSGELHESIYNYTYLQDLEIGINKLSGRISRHIGDLRNIKILEYGFNSFNGSIPASISNLTLLTKLNFQVNNLEGEIPDSIGKLTELEGLFLDHNNFHGGIPLSFSNLTKLVQLELSSNLHLGGSLQSSIFNKLTSLSVLDLAFCNLTGSIPADLIESKTLIALSLAGNYLSGSIPSTLFPGLIHTQYMDLSWNLLEGSIPDSIGIMSSVQYLDISQNKLEGVIPSAISGCLTLVRLNLSQNAIAGTIPESLTSLQSLKSLNLSWNRLEGAVPLNFSPSTMIFLEGNTALCLANASSYINSPFKQNISGISNFCTDITPVSVHNFHGVQRRLTAILTVSSCVVLVCLIWALHKTYRMKILSRAKSTKKHQDLQRLTSQIETAAGGYQLRLSHDQLRAATCNFHPCNRIGEGSYGIVYRGRINYTDGMTKLIAVKVLRTTDPPLNLQGHLYTERGSEEKRSTSSSDTSTELRSFVTELITLSKLRHRNIVRILGYCSNLDIHAIILEYMPNSSLEEYLHLDEFAVCSRLYRSSSATKTKYGRLDWKTRLRIATGVAEALVYLHSDHNGHERIIHGDLKPSNILLDQYMEARVADFGISRTLRQVSPSRNGKGDYDMLLFASVSSFKGTIGYCAPECGTSTQISTKVDVYSYGIVLLEILTRRRPTNEIFGDDISDTLLNLLKYLLGSKKGTSKSVEHSIIESILKDQIPINDAIDILKIVVMCISKDPNKRPSMRVVLTMVKDITTQRYGTTTTNITC